MRRRDALLGAAGFLYGCRPPADAALRETVFEDLDGRARKLAEWAGKVLALNFWATWCVPCREEIPLLMAAAERHRARGLEVIGIAIDLPANVAPYVKSMTMRYPVLLAERGGVQLMRKLGNANAALPFTAFVDAQGNVLTRKLGAFRAEELEAAIARALA